MYPPFENSTTHVVILIGAFAQIVNALGITKIFEDDKDNVEVEGEVVQMKSMKKDVIQKDMSTNETTIA